jgi:excisionase family DNA binding protein
MPQLEKKVVTVEEAGRLLGIGRSASYLAVKRGDIPVIRLGRRIVVPIKALDRLLEEGEPSGMHRSENDGKAA